MNSRIQDFLKDLFEGKNYSWILDTTTNTLYLDPKEILIDAGYNDRVVVNKVQDVPDNHKKLFTNELLSQGTFLKCTPKPLNNYGKIFVTIYAIIDLVQGRKRKATEIKNWLIYEVLPAIDKNGGYVDDSATQEQLKALRDEIDKKLVPSYTRADAATIIGYKNGQQLEDDLLKYKFIEYKDKNIVYANSKYIVHTAKQYKIRTDNILDLQQELKRHRRNRSLFGI